MNSRLPGLLDQIERTGSGSEEFCTRLSCDLDSLSDMELRRLVMAAGRRGRKIIGLIVTRRLDKAAAAPMVSAAPLARTA